MPRRYKLPLGLGKCIPAEQWMVEAWTVEGGGARGGSSTSQEGPGRGGRSGRDAQPGESTGRAGREGVWPASSDRGQGSLVSSG